MGARPSERPAKPEVLWKGGKEDAELEDEEKREAGGPCEKLLMSSQMSSSSFHTSSLDGFRRIWGGGGKNEQNPG